jgi:hypothetical protein
VIAITSRGESPYAHQLDPGLPLGGDKTRVEPCDPAKGRAFAAVGGVHWEDDCLFRTDGAPVWGALGPPPGDGGEVRVVFGLTPILSAPETPNTYRGTHDTSVSLVSTVLFLMRTRRPERSVVQRETQIFGEPRAMDGVYEVSLLAENPCRWARIRSVTGLPSGPESPAYGGGVVCGLPTRRPRG